MSQESTIPRSTSMILDSRVPKAAVAAGLIAAFCIFAVGTAAAAERFSSRANKYEFTIQIPYVAEDSISFDGGSKVDINSDVGFGLGFGYNFSDHLGLDVDVNWNSPYYDATLVSSDTPALADRRSTGQMMNSSWQFNLLYNILTGPVTPYVSGGLGWAYIDTQIANSPPQNSCWWDPWYGNVCYTYQSTYSDWRFAYNAALGVRWDMSRDLFMRASVSQKWIELPNSGSKGLTGGRLELGFSF